MKPTDYWKECISDSAYECELELTEAQLTYLTNSVENAYEHYGMAFYSPSANERVTDIEREWKRKLAELQKEFDSYRSNAETAVKQALHQPRDASVSIGQHGEVMLYDGRVSVIQ